MDLRRDIGAMEGEDMGGGAMTEKPGMELCVPAKSVSLEDANQNLTAPEVGDVVNFTVTGKVTRIEGGNAYITPETINGEDMGQDDTATDDTQPEEMYEEAT